MFKPKKRKTFTSFQVATIILGIIASINPLANKSVKAIEEVTNTQTTIEFCNEFSNEPVKIAIAFPNNISMGWYEIERSQCQTINLGKYEGKVLIHGKDSSNNPLIFDVETNVEEKPFCINIKESFYLNNQSNCQGNDWQQVRGRSVKLEKETFKTIKIISSVSSRFITLPPSMLVEEKFPQTGLKFCNQSADKVVKTAIGFPNGVSRGWYQVKPSQCKVVDLDRYEGEIFYYAQDSQKKTLTSGKQSVCINTQNNFQLKNPSNCQGNNWQKVNMEAARIKIGQLNTIELK